MTEFSRRIELEGCFNFRDLGGWETHEGRAVGWGRLFRADSVHLMTQTDAHHAHEELGLKTLIDLRNDGEIALGGNGLLAEAGLERRHYPLSSRRGVVIDTATSGAPASDRSPDVLVPSYLNVLERSADLIVDAVSALASDEALPAVFFCAAGKDRTGVLSAVILGALGVKDQHIVEDYVLTTDSIDPIITRLGELPGSPSMYRELPPSHFAAHAETMERVVNGVRERYGSFRDYVIANGLREEALEQLVHNLLDDAG
jgi:hypothetical protein